MIDNDKELLEAAAKAAGIAIEWVRDMAVAERWHFIVPSRAHKGMIDEWNPLTDDGDALRLAVKLRIGIVPLEGGGWDCICFETETGRERPLASCADSGARALRESIVRAAAALAAPTEKDKP